MHGSKWPINSARIVGASTASLRLRRNECAHGAWDAIDAPVTEESPTCTWDGSWPSLLPTKVSVWFDPLAVYHFPPCSVYSGTTLTTYTYPVQLARGALQESWDWGALEYPVSLLGIPTLVVIPARRFLVHFVLEKGG